MRYKTYYILSYSIIFFGLIAIFTISIVLTDRMDPKVLASVGIIDYMRQNLQSAPIQEILPLNNSGICPDGYQLQPLGIWPGIEEGCMRFGVKDSCRDKPIPSRPITNWKGYTFCIKHNRNYTFGPDIQCGQGMKKCGIDLCVSEAEKCPITSFKEAKLEGSQANSSFVSLLNRVFELKRDYASQPIYQIEYSILDYPCYANGFYPKKTNMVATLKVRNGCGWPGTDRSVTILDDQPEFEFYMSNNFAEIFFKTHPYYDMSIKNDTALLIVRGKIARKQDQACFDMEKQDQGQNKFLYPELSLPFSTAYPLIWVSGAFLGASVVLLCTNIFLTRKGYNTPDDVTAVSVFALLFLSIQFLCVFVDYFSSIDYLRYLKDAFGSVQNFEKNCFVDEVYNTAANRFEIDKKNSSFLPGLEYAIVSISFIQIVLLGTLLFRVKRNRYALLP